MTFGDIARSGTTRRWSDTTAWNGMLFLCEVPDDLSTNSADQIGQVLEQLKSRLFANDSSPARLLTVTIYLPYKEDLGSFNSAWDAWLPDGSAPVRACIHAALTNPNMRVEIQAIAATLGAR
jgi:enamine deaminase RidA (YjgF/YER057c/UK114 family)